MFLGIGETIGNELLQIFYKVLWGILTGVMSLLDGIQDAFFFLTGVKSIPVNINGKEVESTLLELLFGINNGEFTWVTVIKNGDSPKDWLLKVVDNPIQAVYVGLFGLFILMFVFCIVCAIIKINLNRQDQEALPSMRKMLYKSIQAFFVVILLPFVFCILLSLAGMFMETLINIVKTNLFDQDQSITNCIFKACLDSDVIESLLDEHSKWNFTWVKEFSDKGWAKGFTWEEINDMYGENSLNLFTLTVAVFACLVGIGLSTLTVAERLINIVLLYFLAPFVCASIPLDDGKRWESWKDITTVKIITASANILSIYIFLYLITFLGDSLLTGTTSWAVKIAYLAVTISGAFCCAKASTLIASIISANQGQQEGMSFAATRAMAGAATKLAAGAAGVAGLVAFGSGKGKTGNTNQTSTNNNGGGGNDGPGQDTNYSPDSSNPADTFNNSKKMRNSIGGSNDGVSGSGNGNTGLDSIKDLAMGAGLGGALSTVPTGKAVDSGNANGGLTGNGTSNKTPGGFKKAMNDVKNTVGKVTRPVKNAAKKVSDNGIIGGAAKIVMALAGAATVAAVGGAVFGGRKLAQRRKAKKEEKQRLAQEKQEQQQKLAQEKTDAGLNPIDANEMNRRGINIENPRERVNVDNVNQKREAVWNAKQESKDALAKYPEKLEEANKKYDEASKNYYDLKEKKARGENVDGNELSEARGKLRDAGLERQRVHSQPGMALRKQADAEKKLANAEKKLDSLVNKNTKTDLIENKDVEKSLEAKEPKSKKTSNLNEQKDSTKEEGTANTQTNQPKTDGLSKPGQSGGDNKPQEQKNGQASSTTSTKEEGAANTQTNQPKTDGLSKPGQSGGSQDDLKEKSKKIKQQNNNENKDEKEDEK